VTVENSGVVVASWLSLGPLIQLTQNSLHWRTYCVTEEAVSSPLSYGQ